MSKKKIEKLARMPFQSHTFSEPSVWVLVDKINEIVDVLNEKEESLTIELTKEEVEFLRAFIEGQIMQLNAVLQVQETNTTIEDDCKTLQGTLSKLNKKNNE